MGSPFLKIGHIIAFFQIVGNFLNDIDTEKIYDNISERENKKFFKMKGGILSGTDWNEGLSIARNLRQIIGVILIESNQEEVTDGNKGVYLL